MSLQMLHVQTGYGSTCPVLLRDDRDLVLIDTCFPLNTEALLKAIFSSGHDPAKITKVILTHQDLDHIGCVKDLTDQYPGIQVLCHEKEAPYIEGDEPPVKLAALPEDHELRKGYARRTVRVDHKLKDGERLPVCDGIWVIHTPGHTPGHCCLYAESERALIAGDALNVEGGALIGPNPEYTRDMTQGVLSIRKLLPLDIRAVYTFHGGAFEGDVRAALKKIVS